MTDELRTRLVQWWQRRPLLVALDFDGVLAPIVEQPEDARALLGTGELLDRIAAIDGVHVALVSGRALASLRAVAQVAPGSRLVLVGSHGAEVDGTDVQLDDSARDALAAVHETFLALAADQPGVHVETKPAGVVLHTRRAARDVAAHVTEAALAAADRAGCHVSQGKEVVEVSVIETGKGVALERLRDELGVVGVLYVGDDVTDENAFAVLGDGDVGIKVGDGDTRAQWQVADPEQVQHLLRLLAQG
ncbi:MAG: trehalose-phosphatase [Actinomycetota bacterium]